MITYIIIAIAWSICGLLFFQWSTRLFAKKDPTLLMPDTIEEDIWLGVCLLLWLPITIVKLFRELYKLLRHGGINE